MPKHLNTAADFEMVAIEREHIDIAERVAFHAPTVVLDSKTLQSLSSIQTSFPRSIELDYSDMNRATRAATHSPAIEVSEVDKQMYSGLSTPYFAFESGFDEQ
jgi:hypothetical protein